MRASRSVPPVRGGIVAAARRRGTRGSAAAAPMRGPAPRGHRDDSAAGPIPVLRGGSHRPPQGPVAAQYVSFSQHRNFFRTKCCMTTKVVLACRPLLPNRGVAQRPLARGRHARRGPGDSKQVIQKGIHHAQEGTYRRDRGRPRGPMLAHAVDFTISGHVNRASYSPTADGMRTIWVDHDRSRHSRTTHRAAPVSGSRARPRRWPASAGRRQHRARDADPSTHDDSEYGSFADDVTFVCRDVQRRVRHPQDSAIPAKRPTARPIKRQVRVFGIGHGQESGDSNAYTPTRAGVRWRPQTRASTSAPRAFGNRPQSFSRPRTTTASPRSSPVSGPDAGVSFVRPGHSAFSIQLDNSERDGDAPFEEIGAALASSLRAASRISVAGRRPGAVARTGASMQSTHRLRLRLTTRSA